jgi:hypothetical protein
MAAAGCGTSPLARNGSGPEHGLAVEDGDLTTESQFATILDTYQSGGQNCRPQPNRQAAADLLVASWIKANKPGTLLIWSQRLASLCG